MRRLWVLVLILVHFGCSGPVGTQADGPDHWVATWTTAQLLVQPQTAPTQNVPQGYNNQTIRMIVRTSIGGERLRVKLANAFGSDPVAVGAAHIALHSEDSGIVPGSDRTLTFSGNAGCTIGPGMVILSDPVDLSVPELAHLAVSLYFPGETGTPTIHSTALHTTYITEEGDFTGAASIDGGTTNESYFWLAGIDVMAPADAGLVVAYGDSITDGARSTSNTDHSWPALLAERLVGNEPTANIAVANMGIGGNRVLRDGSGASALARFDRDVLSQSGVRWMIMIEGINDIGRIARDPSQSVTAEELIGAYQQIIERAHTHGIQVIGGTLTPFEGAGYFGEEGEAVRAAVNDWIRTSGAFDGVVDFEAATRDPENPRMFLPAFDPGDHLHPNDDGYQAMADTIDLTFFSGN